MGNLNPFRYRGYYQDAETGFYYLMSRYYDSTIHRFVNADGYFTTGLNPLEANMNIYCGNNPVNYSDPSGQKGEPALIISGAFAGANIAKKALKPRRDLANAPNLNVKTASPTSYNCYGNGIGKQINTDPTGYTMGDSTRKTFNAVKNDLGSDNVRELTSINDFIAEDEFMVAMKCGATDYHFIRLTENGWYNKSGGWHQGLYVNSNKVTRDVWCAMAIIDGEYYEGSPYYTDETIYFAVKVGWDKQ